MRRSFAGAALAASLVPTTAHAQASGSATCSAVTSCGGESGYYVASDDRDKVEKQLDPLLKELRACLDGAGAKQVTPTILVRFDADGKPVATKVEASGYESVSCVASIEGKLVNARSVRATYVRCEYACPKPKPTSSAPPLIVPAPTAPAQTAPAQTAPAQTAPQGAPTGAVQQASAPAPEPPAPAKRTEKVWYGWQNLIGDGVSLSLFSIGLATKTSGVTVVGALGYILGSPAVHWVHGNIGPGFGALTLRALVPPLGLGIGLITGLIAGIGESNSIDDPGDPLFVGAVAGTAIGIAIPMVVDAVGLAYEKVDVDSASRRTPRTFALSPIVDVRRSGGLVGVGATF